MLLLTVDALRADQPWTGYDGIQTPHLSQLAKESVVYTRAYALSNTTAASLGGLLSGRYPSEIARDACVLARYDMSDSLAVALKGAGVHTFAAHGHALFAGDTAPQLGFTDWRLITGAAGRLQNDGAITGGEIADLVNDYLRPADPAGSHFIWAHFVDPHDAYTPHAEFPAKTAGDRPLYDGEVAYTDAVIGRVLESLERSQLAKHTAVIITADHGEAFGEHQNTRHGFTLFEEEIRVPLIVRVPGVAPRTIDTPRSAIDLAPTIAELLGQPTSTRRRGVSLVRDWQGSEPASRAIVVDAPERVAGMARQAVIQHGYKVILDKSGPKVFDLRADPGERAPLLGPETEGPIAQARGHLIFLDKVLPEPCPSSGRSPTTQADL